MRLWSIWKRTEAKKCLFEDDRAVLSLVSSSIKKHRIGALIQELKGSSSSLLINYLVNRIMREGLSGGEKIFYSLGYLRISIYCSLAGLQT